MNVVLPIGWQIVVNDKRNLLYIDSSSQQVSGDEDSTWSRSELSHDEVTFFLIHITMLQINIL